MIEIKLDTRTLPADNEAVFFNTADGIKRRGVYLKEDESFWVSPEEWYEVWHVLKWEAINKNIHETND